MDRFSFPFRHIAQSLTGSAKVWLLRGLQTLQADRIRHRIALGKTRFVTHPWHRLCRWFAWWKLEVAMASTSWQAFVLWHGPSTAPASRLQLSEESEEKHFLFPDRIRWYFWMGGVLGALIFIANACHVETAFWPPHHRLDVFRPWSIVAAFVFLFLCVYVAPFVIYVLVRWSVLDDLSRQLPKQFKSWMLVGVATDGRPRRRYDQRPPSAHPIVMALRWMTPFCSKRSRLAVVYDGLDSRQGRLTRLAMTEFFNSRLAASKIDSIYGWVMYGLSPLWVFLALMILAMVAAAVSEGRLLQKEDLLLFDIAWIILAASFFIIEMPRMPKDFSVTADDLAVLPSQIARPQSGLATAINDRSFRLLLNGAVTIIAVVYATLAALVK